MSKTLKLIKINKYKTKPNKYKIRHQYNNLTI